VVLATYGDFTLYKEYKFLVIDKNKEEYCYEIDDDSCKKINESFVVSKNGKKLERVVVEERQFPLFLKNYDGKNKDINRIFIDKKIPLRERKSWPVIVDKFGELLLVIGIKKFYNEVYDFNGNLKDFYVSKNKGE
jgi:tRNA(Ile)-lysidine synthetase-like protein